MRRWLPVDETPPRDRTGPTLPLVGLCNFVPYQEPWLHALDLEWVLDRRSPWRSPDEVADYMAEHVWRIPQP